MNSGVITAVVSGLLLILGGLVTAWVKRIEGKDKIFRTSVRQDMRIMYALKDDYGQLHSWAVGVRSEYHALQTTLRATGVIDTIKDLPPIPTPTWEAVEDKVA